MTESVDQGFSDLGADLDALSAAEAKELAFLTQLETARGSGQLSPEQQTTLDALRARLAGVTADLESASVDPASADAPADAPAPSAETDPSVPVDAGTVQSGAADPSEPAPVSDPSTDQGTVMPEPVPTMPVDMAVDETGQPA